MQSSCVDLFWWKVVINKNIWWQRRQQRKCVLDLFLEGATRKHKLHLLLKGTKRNFPLMNKDNLNFWNVDLFFSSYGMGKKFQTLVPSLFHLSLNNIRVLCCSSNGDKTFYLCVLQVVYEMFVIVTLVDLIKMWEYICLNVQHSSEAIVLWNFMKFFLLRFLWCKDTIYTTNQKKKN